MLTVKQITLCGTEYLWEAVNVQFEPEHLRDFNRVRMPATLKFSTALSDGQPVEITGGTVFVMNHAGKTVSRYDLGIGAAQEPLGGIRLGSGAQPDGRIGAIVGKP